MKDLTMLRALTISLILIPLISSELSGQLMRLTGLAWKVDHVGDQGLRCEMLIPESFERVLINAEKDAIKFALDLLGPPTVIRVGDVVSIYWSRGSCLTSQIALVTNKGPVLSLGYIVPESHYYSLIFDIDGRYVVTTKIVKSG